MMKGHEKSSDKLSPKVNALLIIDVQEKIIRAIFKKDSITKNIKKLIDAYQILEENIFVSEQNPFKLGATIPELLPQNVSKKIGNSTESDILVKSVLKILCVGRASSTTFCITQSLSVLVPRTHKHICMLRYDCFDFIIQISRRH